MSLACGELDPVVPKPWPPSISGQGEGERRMTFLDEVYAIYDSAAEGGAIPSHPFVGAAFTGSKDSLRIACVGINCYISPDDWRPPEPNWFASWFRQQKLPFSRGAAKAAATVGHALEVAGWGHFDGLESCWATNAIKVYLGEAEGKEAHQVPADAFEKHAATWRLELDVMAAHDVLPHAVVVLGEPQWGATCRSLDPRHGWTYQHLSLLEYQTTPGDLYHHLNRIRVRAGGIARSILVIRVPHPRAFGAKPRAEDLVEHADFQRVVALGSAG